ncbi:MAG: hypothetical protein COU71_01535, partial [Parcubacteria group bacterium CG10_big_fil_rev_8_21_14_0_10_38_31]
MLSNKNYKDIRQKRTSSKFRSHILSRKKFEIEPDEIFLDSKNIPRFELDQLEGRIEKPINKKVFSFLFIFFVIIELMFISRVWSIEISKGEAFTILSENNRLRSVRLFSNRGVIYDRFGNKLSWNDVDSRRYSSEGLSNMLGYIGYPSKRDTEDIEMLYSKEMIGKAGIEKVYNNILSGDAGIKLIETDAHNNIKSESVQKLPVDGGNIYLSVDADFQSELYRYIESLSLEKDFTGGAGIFMDLSSGEVLSIANFPEYDSQVLSSGEPREKINSYLTDQRNPFVDRAVSGIYTPGSIMKLVLAIATLNEKIIDPNKEILSTGSISIPNPFFPDKISVFPDWKAHGLVDMRRALAVSSNVYFYEVGGGFEEIKGLGIDKIGEYSKMFGLGEKTGIDLDNEGVGLIPSPEEKKANSPEGDNIWRIGDTYNASIGQGDFQVTVAQMVKMVSAIATDGVLLTPHLIKKCEGRCGDIDMDKFTGIEKLKIPPEYFKIVKEGMRMAVTDGSAKGLNFSNIKIAAKTGTAEIGSKYVNSWVIGFA